MNNIAVKTVIFWIVIATSALLLWQVTRKANTTSKSEPEISYSEFLSEVDAGRVARVTITGTTADGMYQDGSSFRAIIPTAQEQMLDTLRRKDVEVWYTKTDASAATWLVNLAPLVLLAAVWFLIISRMSSRASRGTNATAGNFGASQGQ